VEERGGEQDAAEVGDGVAGSIAWLLGYHRLSIRYDRYANSPVEPSGKEHCAHEEGTRGEPGNGFPRQHSQCTRRPRKATRNTNLSTCPLRHESG
jgi:hypothetical protein